MPPKYRHFTTEESQGIEPDLMAMLDLARERAGIPFVITSGLRSLAHNEEVGGIPNSAHLPDENGFSQAVDLECTNSLDRWKMVFSLAQVGLKRIVQERTHLHVDMDTTKPQYVLAILDAA